MILIQKPRDVIGGLVVMAIGAGFLLSGQALDLGSSLRMGPGYFPTILSILMIASGRRHHGAGPARPSSEGASGICPGVVWP